MHLAAFAACFLAHRVRPMEVDPEDGAVLIGEDEDVPPVGLPTINEDLRVDPATGARMYDGYRWGNKFRGYLISVFIGRSFSLD